MQEQEMHLSKEKIGFLDPFVIAEDRHMHPTRWEDNHDELKDLKTTTERNKKRRIGHINAMKRLASYMTHMFLKWQDRDYIWAPYHIGLVYISTTYKNIYVKFLINASKD